MNDKCVALRCLAVFPHLSPFIYYSGFSFRTVKLYHASEVTAHAISSLRNVMNELQIVKTGSTVSINQGLIKAVSLSMRVVPFVSQQQTLWCVLPLYLFSANILQGIASFSIFLIFVGFTISNKYQKSSPWTLEQHRYQFTI